MNLTRVSLGHAAASDSGDDHDHPGRPRRARPGMADEPGSESRANATAAGRHLLQDCPAPAQLTRTRSLTARPGPVLSPGGGGGRLSPAGRTRRGGGGLGSAWVRAHSGSAIVWL